ncbi:MAG TPA: sugar phosphate isomerase/epimerase family protein [Bryobacteraceae bacterium]
MMRVPDRRTFLKAGAGLCFSGSLLKALPASSSPIQVGCCVPLAKLQQVVDAGFEYIEPAAADLAALTADEFARAKDRVLASPIRCQAFNSFIRRKDLVVVGPSVNLPAVKEYVDSTLERCRALGASVVVWGSAGSRNVPAGFSRERAWEQIAVFLQAIAPIAGRHDVTVSLEPLNHKESNILNTGGETLKMVKQVNRPEIQMIIDYYHLRLENEPLSIFDEAGKHINHLHFANPAGRLWPKSPDEDPVYSAFFATLKRLNWKGGISVEGKGSPEQDGAQAVAFFRKELQG